MEGFKGDVEFKKGVEKLNYTVVGFELLEVQAIQISLGIGQHMSPKAGHTSLIPIPKGSILYINGRGQLQMQANHLFP